MSSQPATAPCEVCGAATTTRCSSCAKVGIDLFFCSPEHQKLVWRGHKVVCGSGGSAGEISIPKLTDEEMAILQAQSAIPIMSDRGVTPGIKRDLEDLSGRPFEYLLQHLQGPTGSTAELPQKPMYVAMVRAAHYATSIASVKKLSTPPLPCFTLAMQQMQVYMHLANADALPAVLSAEPWHDLLCHKLMILASLDTYHETNFSKWRAIEPLAIDTHARYLRWIAREMVPADDPLTQALVNVPLAQFTTFPNFPHARPDMVQQCCVG
ncbi:putative dentin sialophosphoprotein [Rhodotorula toruloides ATCC 204091]|nr:putative dentin sialophosphoprotein [Rhodotorula toruloides ATCC 204091]KAK4334110.1 putative dentin sialophosphoprotein [Rhodotorula toruloides]